MDRHDHLQGMRAPKEPTAGFDKDAPRVSPELVAHLEAQFPPMEPNTHMADVPSVIDRLTRCAERTGQLTVLMYLRTLAQGAQSGVHS